MSDADVMERLPPMWQRVRARVKEVGHTPRSASIAAGLSPQFLRDVFAGRTREQRPSSLLKLATLLDMPELVNEHNDSGQAQGDPPREPSTTKSPVAGRTAVSIHIREHHAHETSGPVEFVDSPDDALSAGAARSLDDSGWPVYRRGDISLFGHWTDRVDMYVGRDVLADVGGGGLLLCRIDGQVAPGLFICATYGGRPEHRNVLRCAPILWVRRAG